MSRLSDLAIKKLAMRKEAGSTSFTTPEYGYLYERAGYPEYTKNDVDWADKPKYSTESISRMNNITPYEKRVADIMFNRMDWSPLNRENAVVPTRTGYPLNGDITSSIYTGMLNDVNAADVSEALRNWFNPYASKLAYPGSTQQKLDKRFENYQKAK